MADENYKRKLTAILSADVAGYSRLMGDDEAATVSTLKSHRDLISEKIEAFKGRVVDSPGDNILAEFRSIVDAVSCAVEIQDGLKEKNSALPENRQMIFRVGVNLGDVIQDGEQIYGDGVNIAARVECLADPGGIAVSGTAFDHIRNKLEYGFQYSGEHSVNNIANPVRIYKILTAPEHAGKVIGEKRFIGQMSRKLAIATILTLGIITVGLISYYVYLYQSDRIESATVEKMAFELPDKPSVVVLPFSNMSGDPEQEYFSDAITENIITALSRIHNLFVIARNSSFTYKGNAVNIRQVAEELGVRYVLEGSVQKTEDRVRITAQLIDAIEGTHLWAERYDSKLTDIFTLQDKITKQIISSLHVKLTMGEDARRFSQSTDNLEAYLKHLEGDKLFHQYNKDTNILARQKFQEAIAIDANYVSAYVLLAWTHLLDAAYGWTESRAKSLATAKELAKEALAMDDSNPGGYIALSSVHLQKGEVKEAVALRQKGVALAPNSANYRNLLGVALLFEGGRIEAAINEFKMANRLDPFPPNQILHYTGVAYQVNGEYEKAIEYFKRATKRNPDFWLSFFGLTACYGLLGREEEARAAAAEVLRIQPNFSIEKVYNPYRDEADKQRTFEVLRKAGLK
ncbi:FIG140336: TPR domain protein [Olavius algarvensis associated proteobacterium Delta 3]|nr:FIG140336: TPR domain protein [Olavius algarvensis associated proteobacterium Delta 3]